MNSTDFERIGQMLREGKILNPFRLWKLTPLLLAGGKSQLTPERPTP